LMGQAQSERQSGKKESFDEVHEIPPGLCVSGCKCGRPRRRCESRAPRFDSSCLKGMVSLSRISPSTELLSQSLLPRCGGRRPSARRLKEAMRHLRLSRLKFKPSRQEFLSNIGQDGRGINERRKIGGVCHRRRERRLKGRIRILFRANNAVI
jgi:hypothetical protein